ncbi:YicC/YloC family endoribonuclease [Desulfococcus sp.]|uniref:YicC/YloC family endoribonuclease n=1 Tax=Desulfococcus sp. TaxID=2025834 RepID=UPI00359371FB
MTAFSRAETSAGALAVAVELRSYNSRNLDILFKLPQAYFSLEERAKNLISQELVRGRIEAKIQIKESSEEACAFEVDETTARAYFRALVRLIERLHLKTDISLEHLIHVPGLIKPAETEKDMEACWAVLAPCLSQALSELDAMRRREGDFLAGDVEARLSEIEGVLGEIRRDAEGLLPVYRDRLKDRIEALTQGMVEIDPARIAQEAAFLADRSDISEELVRAESHLRQFRAVMAGEEPGGRKLNFLLQEFNREFNTIGSKTGSADVSHRVVWLKSELEKIREQVQNVE